MPDSQQAGQHGILMPEVSRELQTFDFGIGLVEVAQEVPGPVDAAVVDKKKKTLRRYLPLLAQVAQDLEQTSTVSLITSSSLKQGTTIARRGRLRARSGASGSSWSRSLAVTETAPCDS